MKQHYKFSIIIPTYNCAEYISQALNSIIAQGDFFQDCQVLVVDDGSKDHTHKVVQQYCALYPMNIFYTRKRNGNWGSVINYVKNNKLARGDFITVLDADDCYEPTMLQEISKYPHAEMIVTDFYFFKPNDKKKVLSVYYYNFSKNPLINNKRTVRTPHSQPIGKFYAKHVFYALGDLQENKWYQDCVMYHMGVGIANQIQYINQALATWDNKRPGNSTTTTWANNKKFNDWCSTLQAMNDYGAGVAVYVYTLLPGFIKELKRRKKILNLSKRPHNNWMPKFLYFFFAIWIYLRTDRYIKYYQNKRRRWNGILLRQRLKIR